MSKFYICQACGNIIEKVDDGGPIPSCCGEEMKELIPKDTEGLGEKHIPQIKLEKICCKDKDKKFLQACIKIGSDPHPMQEKHWIKWVQLETDHGRYLRYLCPGNTPMVKFKLCCDEEVRCVYAYCNIHGLWSCTKCCSKE